MNRSNNSLIWRTVASTFVRTPRPSSRTPSRTSPCLSPPSGFTLLKKSTCWSMALFYSKRWFPESEVRSKRENVAMLVSEEAWQFFVVEKFIWCQLSLFHWSHQGAGACNWTEPGQTGAAPIPNSDVQRRQVQLTGIYIILLWNMFCENLSKQN